MVVEVRDMLCTVDKQDICTKGSNIRMDDGLVVVNKRIDDMFGHISSLSHTDTYTHELFNNYLLKHPTHAYQLSTHVIDRIFAHITTLSTCRLLHVHSL